MTIEERAVIERREYFRKWRQEHKENVRRYNQKYWEKKAREAAAAQSDGGELIEDQTATEPSSSGTDPEELTDDQLRELVNQKLASVKVV